MAKNVIVVARKLNHAKSNIKYLQDRDDHPETCIFYNTTTVEMWDSYIKKNREEFKRANKKGRCNEARELIFVFPKEYYNLPTEMRKQYLMDFAEGFKKQYGVECIAAMHGKDKESNNLHIHLMYMERQLEVKEHITKIATRRLYFNERGVQVKTRAMCLDADGKMLPGYSFARKGEEYVVQQGGIEWSAKDENLRSNSFTEMQKRRWAYRLNKDREKDWAKEAGIDKVEDRQIKEIDWLYLKMQNLRKPKKYRDKEKQKKSKQSCDKFNDKIKKTNKLRGEYNKLAKAALEGGKISREDLGKRTWNINQEIKEKLLEGKGKEINGILESAVYNMTIIANQELQNETLPNDISKALKEFEEVTNFGRKSVLERISEAKKISEADKKKRDVKIKESDYERF